jgi:hypothetical protein
MVAISFGFIFFFTLVTQLNTMVDGPYTLDKLRSTLIRLEDTIIFGKFNRDLYIMPFHKHLISKKKKN